MESQEKRGRPEYSPHERRIDCLSRPKQALRPLPKYRPNASARGWKWWMKLAGDGEKIHLVVRSISMDKPDLAYQRLARDIASAQPCTLHKNQRCRPLGRQKEDHILDVESCRFGRTGNRTQAMFPLDLDRPVSCGGGGSYLARIDWNLMNHNVTSYH